MLTLENRFPEQWQVEAGVYGSYEDYDEDEKNNLVDHTAYWGSPYVRVGLLDRLAATLKVPYGSTSMKVGEDGTGLGDVVLGLQFLAYEDIFHYPFIIPHVEARLKTGDEEKGLGDGANSLTCGLSVGSVMYDCVTIIVDGRYKFIENVTENYSVGGSIIWDLDEQFALLAEGYIGSMKREDAEDVLRPIYGQAGMVYRATECLDIGLYGGGGKDGAPSVNTTLKVSYTF
ncbi:MAG: hypothetical protein PHG65_04960 [Kiritimatiellae bacterium]|nr:hypothetical protein [Kiritimatiellia bacterium]